MHTNKKLKKYRKGMKKAGIDALIIPSSDPHKSEYVADHWKQRAWVSGFTGSAGIVVITMTHAGVWTDSRYFIQAESELADSEFVMHKIIKQYQPEHIDWLIENLEPGMVVGIDESLFSIKEVEYLDRQLHSQKLKLKLGVDLASSVWSDRPDLPMDSIFEHRIKYAGANRNSKLTAIRTKMEEIGGQYLLLTALDDVAWAFNLRGSDVDCNPVFIAYAIVGQASATLFVNKEKLPTKLQEKLSKEGISIKPYGKIGKACKKISKKNKVILDYNQCNFALFSYLKGKNAINAPSCVQALKAIKNDTEINHLRNAQIKDGVALTRAFMWLDQEKSSGEVTEARFAEMLAFFRSKQDGYFGESFDAIVGFKGNGAIVHYRPDPASSATISGSGILLVDSGGQYQDGTTDITRTILFGRASAQQKKAYTSVLKGYIGLDSVTFPPGTTGGQLDILARQHLWHNHLNFAHGTGHGVGFFLNVHEGPQGIAPSLTGRSATIMQEGMYTSNEPGYYKAGEYGIRIENLILTVDAGDGFLKHDTLTFFPIEKKLITQSLLTKAELKWLNDYHKNTYKLLSPHLDATEKKWLKEKCSPL